MGRTREPIAVVGIGCRFPGAAGPRAFWRLLERGGEAISRVPRQRFDVEELLDPRPGTPGRICSPWGGFLDSIDGFDAAFFGISPREAKRMDPQQRLLLEVAWEALEDGGQVPGELAGSATGVFLGLGADDYRTLAAPELDAVDLQLDAGNGRGVAAGRLSYALDLRGPSLAIDSDRSASLVAVHLACQSLRAGESTLALAGGVNLVLRPEVSIAFSRAGILAPDGRCKAFDRDADGFVRSDGAGIVVLKPLATALADGDPVRALILGSAVNNDGGSGGSLLSPGRRGQEAVLRAAYRDAGVVPGELDYVEAHGTGTPVGDVTEALALGEVLAQGRAAGRHCAVGSVKSNIGHAEAAAGVAGLIKAVLALERRILPASLHCRRPSPEVPWRELELEVQRAAVSWPDTGAPGRAGVSSFGIAGTNAHVVLEQAPRRPAAGCRGPDLLVLPLSARTPGALADLATAFAERLRAGDLDGTAGDLCYTAGVRRSHHRHRLAVVGVGREQLATGLEVRAREPQAPAVVERRRLVFVFSGHGGQWLGMGRALAAREAVFRQALERSDLLVRRHAGWSPIVELEAGEERSRLAEVDVVQPVLFALQTALVALWRSWGIEPDAVVGHSLGEVAAAWAAGALELEDAVRVVVERGRLARLAAGRGGMMLVEVPPAAASETLAGDEAEVAVAGSNAPGTTLLSGEQRALGRVRRRLEDRGVVCHRLRIDFASHSSQMDPLLPELERALERLVPGPGSVPFHSTVTAGAVDGAELDGRYWRRNLRRPVRFAETVGGLIEAGYDAFLEIGGHSVLTGAVRAVARDRGREATVLGSLHRDQDDAAAMLSSLGELYAAGYDVAWRRLYEGGRCLSLPVYPWRHECFWIGAEPAGEAAVPLCDPAPAAAEAPAPAADALREAILDAGREDRRRLVADYLRGRVAELLGVPLARVALGRPLAAQGIDSLLAASLRHDLERALGAEAPVTELLGDFGLEDLARRLAERAPQGAEGGVRSRPGGIAAPAVLTLSAGQKALWFLHRLVPGSAAYHVAVALRLRSSLEAAALERAGLALAARHPALRVTFPETQGEPRQLLSDTPAIDFEAFDAAGAGAAEVEARLAGEAHRPFLLDRGPLLRLRVWSRGPRDHALLLVVHHIVSDFRSLEILVAELAALYRRERGPRPAAEPALVAPPAASYADFVSWQRELLAGAHGEHQWRYWRRRFAQTPPAAELPADRPRPAARSDRGGSRSLRLGPELTARLRSLAGRRNATLFMTLLAGFRALLYRLSGQRDLVIGSPAAGRTRPGLDGVVGFFVNSLALRLELPAAPTFEQALALTRRAVLEAVDHQDFPFPTLVERLRADRTPGRSPLFQVMFVLEQARRPEHQGLAAALLGVGGARLAPAGLELESMALDLRAAQFDLTLAACEVGDGLVAALRYDSDLFDPTTADRLLRHLRILLEGAAADPGRRLESLPVLGPEHRQQLLVEAGASRTAFGERPVLHSLFEARVERAPDAHAVVSEAGRLTFRELDRRADRLACRLRRLGIGPETRVALCVERSPALVVAMLGILKAGGAYLPLDPDLPPRRLAWMLRDGGPAMLVSQESLRGLWPSGLAVLRLRPDGSLAGGAGAGAEMERPAVPVGAGHAAYVLYTSGSTGRPKGVVVSHGAICNHMLWMQSALPLTAADRLLQKTPVGFDASVWEFWAPLLAGARLVLARPGGHRDAAYLARALREHRITVLQVVPSLLRALLEDPGFGAAGALRRLACGGEPLDPELRRRFFASGSRAALINLYGPTEATIDVTFAHLDAGDRGPVTIGRPITGARAYVLDRRLRPLPAGVPGELGLAGTPLARGYLGRAGRTAERFLPDPFDAPGERLYRSGDLGRRRADGTFELLGRADRQLKIRGFRIEPGEIEATLHRHPAVRQAVVTTSAGASGAHRLLAYVTLRRPEASGPGVTDPAPAPVEERQLRRFLGERLPEYMVPQAYVVLESLPRISGGKIDRRALPDPVARPDAERAFTAPSGPVEETLAGLWEALLGLERLGVDENFFELGGDSILAMQIIARARSSGIRLRPDDFFRHKTVARLAAAAEVMPAADPERGPATGRLPLTPIQRRFFDRAGDEPWHFNQAFMLAARRPLIAALLEQALGHLLAHHDALNLRFERRTAGWRQTGVRFTGRPPFSVIDLTRLEEPSSAIESAAAALQKSLDLTAGRLSRLVYFDLRPPRASRLLWVIHHLAVDGVSWRILLEDLGTAYRQLEAGGRVRLPARTNSFKAWAEGLAAHARTGGSRPELAHWRSVLGRRTPLPVDFTGGDNTRASAATVSVYLEKEPTRQLLRRVPAAYGTRINDVLLSALAGCLARWTGARSSLVELEGHGREAIMGGVDLDRTVGWFTTAFPVLLELPPAAARGGGAEGETLKAIKEALRRVPNCGLGFGLLRELNGDHGLRELPLPEVSFNYLGQLDSTFEPPALFRRASESCGPLRGGRERRDHLLEIDGQLAGGRLLLDWTYSRHRHRRATIETLARSFLDRLRALIDHCCSPSAGGHTPSDFPLAGLDQTRLDRLTGVDRDVEDVYPLSPMQQGILFDCLKAPGPSAYCEQVAWELRGTVDAAALRQAANRLAERHAVLRTDFAWQELDRPLQIVRRRRPTSWEERDWRRRPPAEQTARWAELLAADRRRGFDPGHGPLLRLTLARLSDRVHRLLWSNHHLVLDGWSVQILLGELLADHSALRLGRTTRPRTTRRPRPFAYRDYVAWLEGRDLAAAEAFWRPELAGVAAARPLTAAIGAGARGGAPSASSGRGQRWLRTSAPETSALQSFSRRHRLTLNTLIQGVWALLLARYGGRSEVVYGTSVAGRPASLPGSLSAVGLFINTLPMRVETDPRRPLLPWLREVQRGLAQVRRHADCPLAEIQRWSGLPRDQPLFDSLLVFENYPSRERDGSVGLELHDLEYGTEPPYPLALVALPGRRLKLLASYARGAFDAGAVGRLLGHFRSLLGALVADPSRRPFQLPLLSAAERHQLLAEWNATRTAYPRHLDLARIFEARVERRRDAVALVHGRLSVTYRELDRRAELLAGRMGLRGVTLETRVGVCVEPEPARIVSLLAVLKAGGTYVPLDPADPRPRLALLVADARVELVLTREAFGERLSGLGAELLLLDSGGEVEAGSGGEAEARPRGEASGAARGRPRPSPAAAAYVVYTSGSTGRPKATEIPHRAVARLVRGNHYARLGAGEVFAHLAPLSFDASTLEIWGPLLNGGRLVLPSAARPSPAELGRLLRRQRVTLLWLTSGLFHLMVDRWPEALAGLRQLLAGGDVLSPEHVRRALEALPGCRLINGYGPTENTTFSCCHPMSRPEQVGATVSIGRPIANTRAHVLGRWLEALPVGLAGELWVAGDGLARGYDGRPRDTADCFVPDPFTARVEPGGRLYRTGDLARHLPDGSLQFLGRIDDQVKLRGFRVEPGEVARVIARHPAAGEVAVVTRDDLPGGRGLAAYVVAAAAAPATGLASELRRHAGEQLPEYMVPAAFELLESLPLTPNGKLDRRALPAPGRRPADPAQPPEPPNGAVERTVAGIWKRVLGVEEVGASDNFFDLGGHSLLLFEVHGSLGRSGWEVSIVDLIEHPTVRSLSRFLSRGRRLVAPERGGDGPAGGEASRRAELRRQTGRRRRIRRLARSRGADGDD